ncbi:hypothetical protein ACW5YJ_12255 [Staphylococcus sp. mip270_02]
MNMTKKAIKRPDEVEYIEFKGRENFKEVCNFIGRSEPLLTRMDGKECLLLNYYIPNKETAIVYPGKIFYKWNNYGDDVAIYGDTSWDIISKDEFFERYKEDDK